MTEYYSYEGDFSNAVLTYGLSKTENESLKSHAQFTFEDVTNCFPDLLVKCYSAAVLNPEAVSEDELKQLVDVYAIGMGCRPLFIFTQPVASPPNGLWHTNCEVSNVEEIAKNLNLAKNAMQRKNECTEYSPAPD